ncbi:MAG: FAD-dependent oxidoreductase, partial [Myxococcota bacterium]|nr:FAD-dependent oxidoreductase [Myxococcota bacterium]
MSNSRVAIIGAGPVGLEAARLLTAKGHGVTVYEAGDRVGAGMAAYGHVRMFTPWEVNIAEGALEDLAAHGEAPDLDLDATPTMAEFLDLYLEALARHPRIAPTISLGQRLIAASRERALKSDLPRMPQRAESPFRLLLADASGAERIVQVDALIDASGITTRPAWVGRGGIPAPGERELGSGQSIEHHLPDILGADRARFQGKRVLIVGAGYSAATAAVALAQLHADAPDTRIHWAVRRAEGPPVRVVPEDPLPDRARLVVEAHAAARDGGPITLHQPAWVERVHRTRDGLCEVILSHGGRLLVDEVLAMVGYVPDFSPLEALQLELDFSTRGPRRLAELLRQQDRSRGRDPTTRRG